MSYCRWSSDNFDCDLYCYESSEGFVTHVAGARWRTWYRLFFWITDKRYKHPDFTWRANRFHLWFLPHWLTHKEIGLPEDGKTYTDGTPEEFYETVECLLNLGY
jgi:hypothetical protein